MPVDMAELVSFLESDPRFDAAVRSGDNGSIVSGLNALTIGTKVYRNIHLSHLASAIAGVSLTGRQQSDYDNFVAASGATDGIVRLTDPDTRAWLSTMPGTVVDRVRARVERDPTVAEEHGIVGHGESVTLRNVRDAVRQISKSHIVSTGQA